MIDPETARQALDGWNEAKARCGKEHMYYMQRAGDALAVLVPQLLDQLAVWQNDAAKMSERCRQAERSLIEAVNEVKALGERCRQLEGALKNIAVVATLNAPDSVPDLVVNAARAALGDTPPSTADPRAENDDVAAPPDHPGGYDLTDDEVAEVIRASFGEPPQPETPVTVPNIDGEPVDVRVLGDNRPLPRHQPETPGEA